MTDRPTTKATRAEISDSDMAYLTVPPIGENKSTSFFWWAIPLITLSFFLVCVVLVAMVWPLQRYAVAPGQAELVGNRLAIVGADVRVYPPTRGIRFVTAMGNELNPLEAFMGWLDPFVNVQTCEERFGDCNPALNREVQLGAMSSAKEIAFYVALSYLGMQATFLEGVAQVGSFDSTLCPADSPAMRACKVLQVGDIINSIDIGDGAVKITVISDLSKVLINTKPGDIATMTVTSLDDDPASMSHQVKVQLIANPDDSQRTLIGFSARDTRTVKLPFSITFDTDRIGGPSAGLSFTLALIDSLTQGELVPSGGAAVTGTIQEDGSIGAIGALVQKSIAVKKSGAHLFLVPAGQGKEEIAAAQEAVGSAVEIVPVATLQEALDILHKRGGSTVQLPSKT